MTGTQEKQDERGTIMLSREEKRAAQFLALALDKTESDLYRTMSVAEIVTEAARRRALMDRAA
jgi:hypothetical protein